MAAEALAQAGHTVVICEAKSTAGRKFLMAGKSGLNITLIQQQQAFIAAYRCAEIAPMLRAFGPAEVMNWCRDLGQEVFTGSSRRVFPTGMKASPLLRAWLKRLAAMGADLRTNWRWTGFDGTALTFATPAGEQRLTAKVTVLALGGASWSRLGSDAAWVPLLAARGVGMHDFAPANMGFSVAWSPHMARFFGTAVKGTALCVGRLRERGEFVISRNGLEGGGIYAVSRDLRDGAGLTLDLMPDVTEAALQDRFSRLKPAETRANKLRKLGLAPVQVALVMEFGRDMAVVQAIKSLPLHHLGPRPLDEAISVAGGIAFSAMTDGLQLDAIPGVFACGEMLDWEAPTGGYLLTACLATGLWAGRHAALKASAAG